jgi:hypothetical protein
MLVVALSLLLYFRRRGWLGVPKEEPPSEDDNRP